MKPAHVQPHHPCAAAMRRRAAPGVGQWGVARYLYMHQHTEGVF